MKKILFILLVVALTSMVSCKKKKPDPVSMDITSISATKISDNQLKIDAVYHYPGPTNYPRFVINEVEYSYMNTTKEGDTFTMIILNPDYLNHTDSEIYLKFHNGLYPLHTNKITYSFSF